MLQGCRQDACWHQLGLNGGLPNVSAQLEAPSAPKFSGQACRAPWHIFWRSLEQVLRCEREAGQGSMCILMPVAMGATATDRQRAARTGQQSWGQLSSGVPRQLKNTFEQPRNRFSHRVGEQLRKRQRAREKDGGTALLMSLAAEPDRRFACSQQPAASSRQP